MERSSLETTPEALAYVPEAMASLYKIFPLSYEKSNQPSKKDHLKLATSHEAGAQELLDAQSDLENFLGIHISFIRHCTQEDIDKAISLHYEDPDCNHEYCLGFEDIGGFDDFGDDALPVYVRP